MAQVKIPKIPKRLIVGYRKEGNVMKAFPTGIRISNRTKNSPFKIEREKSWLNLIDDKLQKKKVNNILRDGFQLLHTDTHSFSRSGSRDYFYLWHSEFNGHIVLSADNLFQLIQTCTIEKNTIKEELIFDGTDFITEETMITNETQDSDADTEFLAQKEAMKERRVLPKDMVPGKIYQMPLNKKRPDAIDYMVFLGTVENAEETFFITKRVFPRATYNPVTEGGCTIHNRPQKPYAYGAAKIPSETITLPNLIPVSFGGTSQYGTKYIGGANIMASSYSGVNYRKKLPGHFTPLEGNLIPVINKEAKDINMFNGYSDEHFDLIKFMLLHPRGNAPTGDLRNLKTYKPTIEGDTNGS